MLPVRIQAADFRMASGQYRIISLGCSRPPRGPRKSAHWPLCGELGGQAIHRGLCVEVAPTVVELSGVIFRHVRRQLRGKGPTHPSFN